MACFVDYKSDNMDAHTMEMVERSKSLKKEFAPINAEDKVWIHGLNCVNTTSSPKENFINFMAIVGTKNEVCCGKLGEESRFTHPLGTIGLYVKGKCENESSYSESFVSPKEIVGDFVFKKAYDEYMSATMESFWDEDIYELEFLPEKERFMECLESIKKAGIPVNFV